MDKYNFFLKLPLHDLYMNITKEGFRVLEAPDQGVIKILCLVCDSLSCQGCVQVKNDKKSASDQPKNKVKKKKVKSKKKKSLSTGKEATSPMIPHLKLHKCKPCGRFMKNLAALKSHMKVCKSQKRKKK